MAENNAPKAMTKSAVYDEIAKNTDLSKKQIGEVFDALSKLLKRELGKKGPGMFTLPGLAKLKLVRKPATKAARASTRSPSSRRCSRPSRHATSSAFALEDPQRVGQVSTHPSKHRPSLPSPLPEMGRGEDCRTSQHLPGNAACVSLFRGANHDTPFVATPYPPRSGPAAFGGARLPGARRPTHRIDALFRPCAFTRTPD